MKLLAVFSELIFLTMLFLKIACPSMIDASLELVKHAVKFSTK